MTSTGKSAKPQYKTEKVVRDDGSVVNICRCALADMDTLLEIQDRLTEAYVLCDGAIGEIITRPDVQADLQSICSILPLEQRLKGEVQYLNFEDIQENWEQLVALFFNGAIDQETRSISEVSPSRISRLHFLPYERMVKEHLKTRQKQRESEKD